MEGNGNLRARMTELKAANTWRPSAQCDAPELGDDAFIHVRSMSMALRRELMTLRSQNERVEKTLAPLYEMQDAGTEKHAETGESVADLIERYEGQQVSAEQWEAFSVKVIVETACDGNGQPYFTSVEDFEEAELPASLRDRLSVAGLDASNGNTGTAGND